MRMKQLLIKKIKDSGKISFEEFFKTLLYHEKYGYYTNLAKIGEGGDFITSPTLLLKPFSKAIVTYLKKILESNIKNYELVEIGGREGKLTKLITKDLRISGILIEKIPSKDTGGIKFFTSLEKLPPKKYAILGNEILDAIPARRIKFDGREFFESFLKVKDGKIIEIWEKIEDKNVEEYFKKYIKHIPDDGKSTIFEFPEKYYEFFSPFSKFKADTILILIDYGGYPQEIYPDYISTNTIRGYKNNRLVENIFELNEAIDITYHVNFKFVEEILKNIGYIRINYETQGKFLVENGILDFVNEKDMEKLKTLILPGGMGEIFKVITFKKGS